MLQPRQVVIWDKALMVLLKALVAGLAPLAEVFPTVDGPRWRRAIARMADLFWVPDLQLVPRSLRPGGACYLHLTHHWPLPDIVIRGSWAKFEATHSYLQTGLYASIGLRRIPAVKEEGQRLEARWPRGMSLPLAIRGALPAEVEDRFRLWGGPGGGTR